MKFEVVNSDELLQFIKDYNVDTEKSNLQDVFKQLNNGTNSIKDIGLDKK